VVTTNATPMLPARHSSTQVISVITITGLGDHDQPDQLITMTGIRMRSWPDAYVDAAAVDEEGALVVPHR
jgi:hypothetical protein